MRKLLRPYFTLLLMGSLAMATTSCNSDNDDPEPKEEEVVGTINSLRIEFRPQGQPEATPITAAYSDENQDDGKVDGALIGELKLAPGTTYDVKVMLTDESQSPPVDVSAKTKKAQDYHEFFYLTREGLKMNFVKTDKDANGLTVGFTATATTSVTPSKGVLRVHLKHQKKGSEIIKTATSNENTGSTDFFAVYPITVESL